MMDKGWSSLEIDDVFRTLGIGSQAERENLLNQLLGPRQERMPEPPPTMTGSNTIPKEDDNGRLE